MTSEDLNKLRRTEDPSIHIEIPANVSEYIDARVKEVENEDPYGESGKLQAELLRAELEAAAKFMTWVQQTQNPQQVLYVGPDMTEIPKRIFGETQVLQVKLETQKTDATQQNEVFRLPISDQTVDLAIVEPPFENQFKLRHDLARIAQVGGNIVVSRTLETYEDAENADPDPFSKLFPGFERAPIPEAAQNKDPDALRWVEFFMFRKVSDDELARPIEEPLLVPKPERIPWVEHELSNKEIPQLESKAFTKFHKKAEEQDKEALRAVLTPEGIGDLARVSIERKIEKMRSTFAAGDSVRLETQLFLWKVRDGKEQENEEVIDQLTLWNKIEEGGQMIALNEYGKFLDVDFIGLTQKITDQIIQQGIDRLSMRVATKDEMFEVEVFYQDEKVKYRLIKVRDNTS